MCVCKADVVSHSRVFVSLCAPCVAFARLALQQGQRRQELRATGHDKPVSQTDQEGAPDGQRAARVLLPENTFY